MPFCPVCKYEYVDGQVECIDCGVTLVDELPMGTDRGETDSGGSRFVPFRAYPSTVHAEMIREALANEGISAIVKGNELYGSATGMPSDGALKIMLWVPEDEQEQAARIADSILDPI